VIVLARLDDLHREGPSGALLSEEALAMLCGSEHVHKATAIVEALSKLLAR
jgi:hypothetical protein